MTEDYCPDDEDYALRCPGCHRSCPGIQPIRVDEYTPSIPGGYAIHDEDGNEIGWHDEGDIPGATEYEPVYVCPHCSREFFTPYYDSHRPILMDSLLSSGHDSTDDTDGDEDAERERPL